MKECHIIGIKIWSSWEVTSPEINKDLYFPLKGSVSHLANSMQALVPLFRMSFMSWQGLMRLKHVCSSQLLRHCQQFRREHLKQTNSNDQTINTNAYNMFLMRLLANITFSLYTLNKQLNSSSRQWLRITILLGKAILTMTIARQNYETRTSD